MDAFWQAVSDFRRLQQANGRRARAWMWERIDSGLREAFAHHAAVRERLPQLTEAVLAGRMVASAAARSLLSAFFHAPPMGGDATPSPSLNDRSL